MLLAVCVALGVAVGVAVLLAVCVAALGVAVGVAVLLPVCVLVQPVLNDTFKKGHFARDRKHAGSQGRQKPFGI